jgi:hypothetical protein
MEMVGWECWSVPWAPSWGIIWQGDAAGADAPANHRNAEGVVQSKAVYLALAQLRRRLEWGRRSIVRRA